MCSIIKPKPVPKWNQVSKGMSLLAELIKDSKVDDVLVNALWSIAWMSGMIFFLT